MKALLINSLTSGGAERIVLNIYRSLRDKGKDIMLICLSDNNVYEVFENDKIINLSKANFNDRGLKVTKILLFPLILYRLYKVVKKYDIDTVQSHLFLASAVSVIAKKLFRANYKIQIVSHMYLSYEKGFAGLIKLKILKSVYNSADKLISISQKMKMDINANILYKNLDHLVITNPHDIKEILKTSGADCPFMFNPEKKYVITCGRLVKRKKIDSLIKAIHLLSKATPVFDLLVLGDGDERGSLEKLANDLHIAQKVHFIGHVSNPFNYIARSDFFVLSSESEGLPNVIIESMLCKTFVISTDCPTGPRELLATQSRLDTKLESGFEVGNYGILVPIGNEEAISEALKYCAGNKDMVTSIVEAACEYAKNFSLENKILEYENVLY
jgi:glycosyltransferase involved in cell wall biosynthesis